VRSDSSRWRTLLSATCDPDSEFDFALDPPSNPGPRLFPRGLFQPWLGSVSPAIDSLTPKCPKTTNSKRCHCYTSTLEADTMPPPPERRDYARFKIKIPLELHFEDNDTPFRCATADLSLFGCYIESMYPFPIGTPLELKLHIEGAILLVLGTIVTSDPQVGNGIKFTKMLPEDEAELKAFLEAMQKEAEEKEAEKKEEK